MSYTYPYPRPAVAADAVILSQQNGEWEVLLIQRKNEPFKDQWALPGGFLDKNEDPDHAVHRELQEETSLTDITLEPISFWGRPGRDPRGHIISLVYRGIISKDDHQPVASDDAKALSWFALKNLPVLAFDHKTVITDATKHLTTPNP